MPRTGFVLRPRLRAPRSQRCLGARRDRWVATPYAPALGDFADHARIIVGSEETFVVRERQRTQIAGLDENARRSWCLRSIGPRNPMRKSASTIKDY